MYERGFKVQESDPQAEERRTESYRSQISARIGGLRERYENRIAAKAENLAERYRSVEPDHLSSCRISAAATIRADQSIQQLYASAINTNSQNFGAIGSSFNGYDFNSIYLEWEASKSNRKKRDSVEANSNLSETSSVLIKTQQLCADMLNQAKK